ncbi:anti-sigma factor domain-containing protein [Nocardia sp. NPDC059177]|uniref:anti-sigma factor n=1 Tax=Nocardia sp. NPDC059177 TaxID=3346759 RepID=UPI0036B9FFFF
MSETDRWISESRLDQAYAYALDALEPQQRRAVDDWLDTAGSDVASKFRATVHRIQETMATATVVDSVPPPARLESALMRALDQLDPQVRPPAPRDALGRRRNVRWLTAAAAAVVAVVAGIVGAAVIDRATDDTGAITAQQVVDQSDSRESSVAVTGGGAMTVYESTALGAAAVSFRDLPALPADRTYQLWIVPTGGAPRSVAVMDDPATVVTAVDATDTLAVTVEPAGGSPAPSPPVIASMTVG